MTKDVFTLKPEDTHSFWDYEMAEGLAEAIEAAHGADGEAAHYLHLEDGRVVSGMRVECETLTDGSKACTIYLKVQ